MKKFLTGAITATTFAIASADDFYGPHDYRETSMYTVYNNMYDHDRAVKGRQGTGIDTDSDSSISWHTSYNWTGILPDSVKSYANAALRFTPKQIKDIKSILTTMNYSYYHDSGNSRANVANVVYNLLINSGTGSLEYEIKIWVASYGDASLKSFTGMPIDTIPVDNTNFKLFKGRNGNTTVYSFVADTTITNFSADLLLFLNLLVNDHGLPSNEYLTTLRAGTETFYGTNAGMIVSFFSAAVK